MASTKQTYYLMNQEEQKLKSLRNYYVKQLKTPNLKSDKKEKYETKLNELNAKLSEYDVKRNAKKSDDEENEDKRLKSLRYYYVKQLKNPNLDNDKKVKYESKLNELNQKISNVEINETNLEELNQQKVNYENKLNSINELKLKYENKLREINEMINTLTTHDEENKE